MLKTIFKQYNQGQISLFPARLDDKIPVNAPVRLVTLHDEQNVFDIVQ